MMHKVIYSYDPEFGKNVPFARLEQRAYHNPQKVTLLLEKVDGAYVILQELDNGEWQSGVGKILNAAGHFEVIKTSETDFSNIKDAILWGRNNIPAELRS